MTYRIDYEDDVVRVDIPALPKTVRTMVQTAIQERLMVDPVSFGKPLRFSLKGYRRIRVGDYRIVYHIDPRSHAVVVVAIKHRKDVYA